MEQKRAPLPDFLKAQIEQTFGKKEGITQGVSQEILLTHQKMKAVETDLFNIVIKTLKENRASEEEIRKTEDDFKEFMDCWERVFMEDGEKTSMDKVHSLLPPNNLWVKRSMEIALKLSDTTIQ